MRVPFEWVKQYVDVEGSADEIGRRLTMGGLEVEGIEDSAIGPVLDVYVTPNRGDCLSMTGVAREIAALFGQSLKAPAPSPSTDGGEAASLTRVEIEDLRLCPRYAARLVRNVKVGPSPEWMQRRLEAAGMRPIGNVVDVTNYVMLEMGQPLHAFDLALLRERRIVVRRARPGERITTLDGAERELSPEMLVIADAERPVAVAGVMGGADSEVSDGTTELLLESAHFDALSVRRTKRALEGIKSESAYRFERVVDPNGVRRALDRACDLLAALGAGEIVDGVVDVYPHPIQERVVSLRVPRAAELLGMDVPSHVAADCLRALGFDVRTEPHGATDVLQVHVPTFRADVNIEEDLVEEVGRIYGYENIPETLPYGDTTPGGDSAEGIFQGQIRSVLTRCGLQEVVTHSLTAPSFFDSAADASGRVAIRNALSAEVSGLRHSLLPSLLDVAQSNAARGRNALGIFEIGRVWRMVDGEPDERIHAAALLVGAWAGSRGGAADFAQARGILERLCAELGLTDARLYPPASVANIVNALGATEAGPDETQLPSPQPNLHPGRCAILGVEDTLPDLGVAGELHPRLAVNLPFRDPILLFELSVEALRRAAEAEGPGYAPVSRFPAVLRDLAPRVASSLPYLEIERAVRGAEAASLEELRVADIFTGPPLPEGIKSITLSLTFRAVDHALSETEVNGALARIVRELEERCAATFAQA
jgi:phenylalanyl-tRNA synthetase beta chain